MYLKDSQAVADLTFWRVLNCKYLGVYINQQTNSHGEINRRIIMTRNKYYFSLVLLFKSKLLYKIIKISLYKGLIRPISRYINTLILYACGAWASIKLDKNTLMVHIYTNILGMYNMYSSKTRKWMHIKLWTESKCRKNWIIVFRARPTRMRNNISASPRYTDTTTYVSSAPPPHLIFPIFFVKNVVCN